jgi:Flp pilus assembly protein TadG
MSCSVKQFGRQRKPRRKGAALLEMLLVLPILLMLSLGVVDYGYYLYLKNTFQSAAEAGARAAVPYAASNSSVTGTNGIVTQMMTAGGFPAASYTVTLSPSNVSSLSAGTQITVTISALWGNVGTHALGSSFGGMSNSKTVVGTAVMQKEAN